MDTKDKMLEGKKVLVVDDEPDVLETMEDILSMCEVVKASTFEEGRKELEGGPISWGAGGPPPLLWVVQKRPSQVL